MLTWEANILNVIDLLISFIIEWTFEIVGFQKDSSVSIHQKNLKLLMIEI